MKLIISTSDFLNENSKNVILRNIEKNLKDNKALFIPNEKATKEKINSDKYYDRLRIDGFENRDNIYIFDESNVNKFRNLDIDLIYIGGGNTFATLNKIKKCHFDKDIIQYVKNGVIYIGGSCGAHIVTKNIKHLLELDDNYLNIDDYDGLGLFNGIVITHFDQEGYNPSLRRKVYNSIKDSFYEVYTLTEDESLVITDDKIIKEEK